MRTMTYKDERVVYIVYHDGIPHDVITVCEKGFCTYFDFNFYYGDKTDIRFYESGGGGHMTEIYAPQYVDGCTGITYWMAEGADFRNEPKNITRIEKPLRIKHWRGSSVNPFKAADEICERREFCDRCHQTVEGKCYDHQYIDEEDTLRYIDNNEEAE